mgnify:CR=1 FL=1
MKRSGAIEYASYASFENTGQCISLQYLDDAFGIDLITVASLGTSPISSVPLVVSLYTPWTFGQLTFVLNMAFIVLQIALLRRQFRPVELLQIAINFVFSAAIDFFMHAMAGLQGLSWPFAAALLVAGCATLASASASKWRRRS